VLEGSFTTPFVHHVPDLLPTEIHQAKFQLLVPTKWKSVKRPVVFHFAGTGDQNFWRRRVLLAKPLLTEHSVASLILENPYYGSRKPKNQDRSNLVHVKDLFIMGACLITEGLALMNWCERMGLGPFVLSGFSMGGHMASLTSTVYNKPLALVPCLSWTTAGPVFTRGVMSKGIAWDLLKKQYYANKEYADLKTELKELHELENRKRAPENQYIWPFESGLNGNFWNLTTFNKLTEKEKSMIEIYEFMHLLMDECTHLLNYSIPVDTNLIRVISAKDDAYVLRDGVNDFNSIWPGSEVEYVDKGHVSAFVLLQNKFRQTIMMMLNKLLDKYP